jgi:hypothetical protein
MSAARERITAARRAALLEACWNASAVHSATTVAMLLIYLTDHIRQRPDFDTLNLERVVDWLDGLRARQADRSVPVVGRAAVNGWIDKIITTFDAHEVHS